MNDASVYQPPLSMNSTNFSRDVTTLPATLNSGDVFRLKTHAKHNTLFDSQSVMIYTNWSLGLSTGSGFEFEGSLIREYNLLLMPEPLQTVKLNEFGLLMLNDSLYSPDLVFENHGSYLNVTNSTVYVCPSWDNVIVSVESGNPPPAPDSVEIDLVVAPVFKDDS